DPVGTADRRDARPRESVVRAARRRGTVVGGMKIHVSDEWDPRARGLAFGAANAEAVRNTVEVYRRLGCELSAGGRVRVSDDEHEEIFGIALGAGVDGRELLAVNARTELMASRAGECSTVGQGGILAQNWDWHPDLADSTLVWIVR